MKRPGNVLFLNFNHLPVKTSGMKTIVFQNKVCWITGASGGIGAALAMALK
jgi:hypothetical protein